MIGALGALMVAAFGASRTLFSLLPFVVLLGAVTVIDLRELRVPNKLVGPAALIGLPLLLIASTAGWSDLSFGRALVGAAGMGAGYFVLALIYPAGMGLGDVKLSPIIGCSTRIVRLDSVLAGTAVCVLDHRPGCNPVVAATQGGKEHRVAVCALYGRGRGDRSGTRRVCLTSRTPRRSGQVGGAEANLR